MSEALTQMINALGLEIEAIKKKGGSSTVEVIGGQLKGKSDNNYLYTFPVSNDVYFRDDSPIKIIIGKEESDGLIISFGNGVLVIASERDFGPQIPYARLKSDDSFLIERLKEKLTEINSSKNHFNYEKAEQVIGNRPIKSSDAKVDNRVFLGAGDPLNEEQQSAVRKALGTDITFIWGPPGTGKTTVLARIVEGYYYAGLSVLLVSNTNIAVDTALEKIAARLKTDEGFQQGAVLRHGPIFKSELTDNYGDRVDIEKVVNRLGQRLATEKAGLENQRGIIDRKAILFRNAMTNWNELEKAQTRLSHSLTSLEVSHSKEASTRSTISSLGKSQVSLKDDLQRSRQLGPVRKFFSGLNTEKILRNLATTEAAHSANISVLKELQNEITSIQAQIPDHRAELERLKGVTSQHLPHAQCQKELSQLESKISDINNSISEIQRHLDELRSQVISNCKILATTIYRTYLKGQVERSFDVVVIDEASMLALPMAYYGAGLAAKHVVVAGDFRQLPPIIMSRDELAEEWLKQDVFYKANIVGAVKKPPFPDYLVALKKQYRMAENICNVINDLFYDDHRLETPIPCDSPEQPPFPFGASNLLYLDTSSYHPWTSLKIGTYSRYNILHGLILRNLAYHISQEQYLNEHINAGVISPYSAQARLIQRLLDVHINKQTPIISSTVHRFQGNEKDVMFIDITDSIGTRPSKFVMATELEQDGARLLNVAFSRAKKHIVLVANFDYLKDKLSPASIVRKIMAIFIERGTEIDIEQILPLGPDGWVDCLRTLDPFVFDFDGSKAGIFNEGTFYQAFRRDLIDAEDSVVIFSPFITQNGTARWMDILGQKISQNIPVRLVVRPPGDHGGVLEDGLDEIIQNLAKTGVIIDFRARMHEKFAIIDKEVLWHGSLNIFSHRNTSESMFRIPTSIACEEMMRLVASGFDRKKDDKSMPNFTERENPACPNCSKPMVWKNGRYSVYFECESCGEKFDPRSSRSRKKNTRPQVSTTKECAKCGKPMRKRNGKFGLFWGCSGYPRCKYTEQC